jgi:methyl-accepting chemotaxis protein
MLIENKNNGETLSQSSNTLLENVEKLNESSTTTAANLEETAASLEEMTSNLRSSTQNVEKMSNIAMSVTSKATSGENLAKQTAQAMEEINKEVTSINEAITVIDNIAFQTNILSLNAAVEAATAGEAGKGFAVVAQEVRNLASRSAEAAKEIKELVESATKKANSGKTVANEMIDGYLELNSDIQETINLIKDFENASKEQLLGIEQINSAVSQLDQKTQENANVTSATKDIAISTNNIAKLIIDDVNEKRF